MTETKKLDRIVEIVKMNSSVLKIMRRFMLRWMKGMEKEIKLQYKDIQQMKNILIAVAKKIQLEGADELGEIVEIGDPQYIPKSADDLQVLESKISRDEWSYYT